ncbi:MAG: nucleotide pyrophosphatase [bacterium]|nr:nucleotide pyrophosphatase [bacterium]
MLGLTAPAEAYIGPGAGVALVSSFLVMITTLLLAFTSLLLWPIRTLIRVLKRQKPAKPRIGRLIVVGFDGQDPRLTDRFLKKGILPNFARLADKGCYRPLGTTSPSVSPVAWSSFSTGTHPARHRIFDFLDRDPRTYLPVLSSAHIGKIHRQLKIGRIRIPLSRPDLRLLRKSKPFWSVLGEHGIWSTILRVPITFPPEDFYGAQVSGMCVPDLIGTQGSFILLTTRSSDQEYKEGGIRTELTRTGDGYRGKLEGPTDPFLEPSPTMALPVCIRLRDDGSGAHVTIGKTKVELETGKLSEWVSLTFRTILGVKVSGISRLQLIEAADEVSLYVSPINLDPEKPAMPVSHPAYYSTYLAKRIGPHATLGLAEDTWALNEEVIDDATFLQQTNDIDDERRQMFFTALDRLDRGSLVCVFDATDRIQHMFWRYLEDAHPALKGREPGEHKDAIEDLYRRNDEMVGQVMERLNDDDVLMVISDHGFTSFRRGVNINSWLKDNGYLVLKDGADGSTEWLQDVDWSKTRAYALGLTGVYVNLAGREGQGIVQPGDEADQLRAELQAKLHGLIDEETGEVGINEVFRTTELYSGPYLHDAPDLLVGFNHGYRVSWDCATGMANGPVFEDNTKAWSGDHCVDPRIVSGVFFCNRSINGDQPRLIDLAPTALDLFGLEPPAYMDGVALMTEDEEGDHDGE